MTGAPLPIVAADGALIAEPSRRIDAAAFDEEPLPGLDSEAIDFAAASPCRVERLARFPDAHIQARHAGLLTRATQHRLAALAERGLVVVVGSGPRDPRRRWFAAGTESQT